MRKAILATVLLVAAFGTQAAGLGNLSRREVVTGLKEALQKGAGSAVGKLGQVDGFLGNERVKIPLPESLQKADKTLRKFGMSKYADELVVTMNRAAETVAPEARLLLFKASHWGLISKEQANIDDLSRRRHLKACS